MSAMIPPPAGNTAIFWAKSSALYFQYYLVNKDGSAFRIHDPYTEIVYDGSNDKYISSSTYPDLPAYPKGTSGLVSAFKVNKDVYNWTSTGFKIADRNDLVIYEMHFRNLH